jgi:hypothetical protein
VPPLIYSRHPDRLRARHTRIVETLLAMNQAGHGVAVSECIRMCRDLRASGHDSRYAKPLRHLPGAWELKPTTRGGLRGGVRVYFFWLGDGRPLLTGAEYKAPGAGASDALLDELVDIADAVKKGVLIP